MWQPDHSAHLILWEKTTPRHHTGYSSHPAGQKVRVNVTEIGYKDDTLILWLAVSDILAVGDILAVSDILVLTRLAG